MSNAGPTSLSAGDKLLHEHAGGTEQVTQPTFCLHLQHFFLSQAAQLGILHCTALDQEGGHLLCGRYPGACPLRSALVSVCKSHSKTSGNWQPSPKIGAFQFRLILFIIVPFISIFLL